MFSKPEADIKLSVKTKNLTDLSVKIKEMLYLRLKMYQKVLPLQRSPDPLTGFKGRYCRRPNPSKFR